jgi:hypothetical protein
MGMKKVLEVVCNKDGGRSRRRAYIAPIKLNQVRQGKYAPVEESKYTYICLELEVLVVRCRIDLGALYLEAQVENRA